MSLGYVEGLKPKWEKMRIMTTSYSSTAAQILHGARGEHTHLPQELLHMIVKFLIGEVELLDDTVGLVSESHGDSW